MGGVMQGGVGQVWEEQKDEEERQERLWTDNKPRRVVQTLLQAFRLERLWALLPQPERVRAREAWDQRQRDAGAAVN